MNKNQQRQAKTYTLDESEFTFLVTANNHLNVIFLSFQSKEHHLFKHVWHNNNNNINNNNGNFIYSFTISTNYNDKPRFYR